MAVTSTGPRDEDIPVEAAEAGRAAWSAPGVTEVDNHIVVGH